MGTFRHWDPEELRAKLERTHGSAALRIVRELEQRLDAEYSGSAVTIRWRGSDYRESALACGADVSALK